MRLKHIAIRDLAGIARVELRDLDRGLNVLVGNNEAGKSTVLTALRAAIFHRHGSGSRFVKDLSPYARSARPEVDLEFELGGVDYRLEKRFLQKPEARLSCSSGDLVGEAVEERLAELFGFSPYSGRGDFELEKHQGTFGLLWVEQGRSTQGLDLGAGRDAVAASLEAEVGQILGGDRGRDLIAAARVLRDRHYTATGKVATNSDLAEAERELKRITDELDERRATKRALDASIDRLADRRRIVESYRRDRIIELATEAVAVAERAEQALDGRRRDLVEAGQSVEIAAAAVERAAGELVRRRDTSAAAERALRAAGEAAARQAEAMRAAEASRLRGEPLAAELAAAEARTRDAAEALRRAEGAQRREGLASRLAALGETLSASRQAAARIASGRAALARASLDERGFKAILAADAARREAAIGRDAAAPAIVFSPDEGRCVRAADAPDPIPAGTPIRVARPTRFVLEGFGTIEIRPDAASQSREAAHAKAVAALEALLRPLGLSGPNAAEGLREETRRLEAEIREAEVETKARAPHGLAVVEAEAGQIAAELDDLPVLPADSPGDIDALRAALSSATQARSDAEAAFDAWRHADAEARSTLSRAEFVAATAAAESDRLSGHRRDAEGAATEGALLERLDAAETMRAARAAVLAAIRRDYEAADPDAVRRDIERTRRAQLHASRDHAAVVEEVRDLEAEIRQTGGLGIGEEIERLAAERQSAETRLARLGLEARAARLLYETLKTAETRVRQTWFAPIRREVEPYLKLIHPGTEVAFDDATLAITGLTRGGVEEDFRRLSAGAREQVAVVTRLALAEVLKRGGHPAAVILDDALVNTDEERLQRMHLVLQKAGEGLQVLVLTCRPRDFQALGAPIFRL